MRDEVSGLSGDARRDGWLHDGWLRDLWRVARSIGAFSVAAPASGAEMSSVERRALRTSARRRANVNSPQWLASLGRRALTAFALIPLIIALVVCGGWFAFGGAVAALLIAAWELRGMFAHKGWFPPIAFPVAFGLDMLLAAMLFIMWHNVGAALLLTGLGISLLLVLSFGWLMLTRGSLDRALVDWALTMGSAFYLGWPLTFFLLLRGGAFGVRNAGFAWLLALFFMVWANDTFALLAGHYFGRTKLAPHVSPAKTWEGFAGGLVFTVIAALVFLLLIPHLFALPVVVAWYHAVLLGVFVAVASTIGDLAESLLKRGTGVKDSGAIVPGHGGLLDRMDSLLFAVLIVFFYAAFLGAIHL